MSPTVSVIDDDTDAVTLSRYYSIIDSFTRVRDDDITPMVAFDVEGVNLSRAGSVELVSLELRDNGVYLVDVGGRRSGQRYGERVASLKKLLECKDVLKVIHDCRMDSDALFHLLGIDLNNIHDTSSFHQAISHFKDANLNDLLSYNGLPSNRVRDTNVYRSNPRFWATRPLTREMVEWATSDVDKLIDVAVNQNKVISLDQKDQALQESKNRSTLIKQMALERRLTLQGGIPVGVFIGRKGCNIQRLEERTGTMIMKDCAYGSSFFMVFYPTVSALAAIKSAMGYR
jgi:exonuclease 3'-5' domain-containing protein 1